MSDFIIETRQVSKLYGIRREDAMGMLRKGATKEQVLKETVITTALYESNLQIPPVKYSLSRTVRPENPR
jgi:ABC-type proline/glycine betaine transport system ATPase subunit